MLSFFLPPPNDAPSADIWPLRLNGINKKALLDHAVAQFLLGSALRHLVVDLAARIGVF